MSEMDQELNPETPEADAVERLVNGDDSEPDLRQVPFDADEADAVEQRTPVREDGTGQPRQMPFDADEADAAEQRRHVGPDDDDYR